jgi:hypothetical protein
MILYLPITRGVLFIVEIMNDNDKNVIKTLIDAFITKGKLKQLAL